MFILIMVMFIFITMLSNYCYYLPLFAATGDELKYMKLKIKNPNVYIIK